MAGVHEKHFTYRTVVRCSCHPGYFGEGDNRVTALRNLEERIEADVKEIRNPPQVPRHANDSEAHIVIPAGSGSDGFVGDE